MLYSHFVGRIGKDGAKVINGKWGDFMSMDVATGFYSKGENKTQWIRVRSKRANHIKLAQYLTQGRMILVQGTQLEDSSWTGKDNQPHSQHVIIADSIDFVRTGKKREDDNTQENVPQAETMVTAVTPVPEQPFPAPDDNSDDLPF